MWEGGGEFHKIRDPIGYKTLITGNMSNENDDVRQKWPAEVDIFFFSALTRQIPAKEVIMMAF